MCFVRVVAEEYHSGFRNWMRVGDVMDPNGFMIAPLSKDNVSLYKSQGKIPQPIHEGLVFELIYHPNCLNGRRAREIYHQVQVLRGQSPFPQLCS